MHASQLFLFSLRSVSSRSLSSFQSSSPSLSVSISIHISLCIILVLHVSPASSLAPPSLLNPSPFKQQLPSSSRSTISSTHLCIFHGISKRSHRCCGASCRILDLCRRSMPSYSPSALTTSNPACVPRPLSVRMRKSLVAPRAAPTRLHKTASGVGSHVAELPHAPTTSTESGLEPDLESEPNSKSEPDSE